MLSICPECSAELAAGALRCHACGADSRHAGPTPLSLSLHHLAVEIPPRLARSAEIVAQHPGC